jgi:hypothetical protein
VTMTDVTIISAAGSLVGFTVRTDEALRWFADNVASDGWQWMGSTIWIDHRYAHAITDGIAGAGLTVD